MSASKRTIRRVWPVDPARWTQEGDGWAGEILIPRHPAPPCDYLVAVKLPDGRLVPYGAEELWRFPREWQPVPTGIPDYQI
jgi:hypothetical protein